MSKMILRKAFLTTAAAGAMVLGMAAESANAVTVTAQIMVGGPGVKKLSDNSAEVIKGGGDGDTILEVGETLRGILQIQTVENISPVPSGLRPFGVAGVNELSALFEATVLSAVGAGCGGGFGGCTYTFGPSGAAFEAELAGYGFTGTAGAAIAFFEDPTPDFSRTGASVAADELTAIGPTPFWLFGFTGDDFWNAIAVSGDTAILPPAGGGGFFNIGLSLLENYTSMKLSPIPCLAGGLGNTADACGTGLVGGPDVGPWPVWDDVNFTISVSQVPEPGTLGLFGFSLLGLGFLVKRREKKA
jgi:hypothetical protein